jgi:hypothetical protein
VAGALAGHIFVCSDLNNNETGLTGGGVSLSRLLLGDIYLCRTYGCALHSFTQKIFLARAAAPWSCMDKRPA